MRRQLLTGLASLPLLGVRRASAQQFPSKPIKIIVAVSAGVSVDIVARYFSEPLSKRLNTPVFVENRPGAGGLLGFGVAAKAAPDGYTIALAGIPLYLSPLITDTPAPYDPVTDFVPIARVARVPLALVVSADSPYQSLADLIQAMKQNPGALTYSSVGIGSTGKFAVVLLNDMTKTKAREIGYKETAVAITDVVGGRVAFTCQGSSSVLSLVQAGRLRALAVTGSSRWAVLPAVPTVAEAGVPGFEISSWLDFVAPRRTPTPVVQMLSDAIAEIAGTPEFKDFCATQVMSVDIVGSKPLLDDMAAEARKWKQIVELSRAA